MSIDLITPEQAATKFADKILSNGFVMQALHEYKDRHGNIIYWRIRLKHPDGSKWIRPMSVDSNGCHLLSEPLELKGKLKPLYGLHLLAENTNANVVIVEGEYPADILNIFFAKNNSQSDYIAITSGSATSADSADWSPLVHRRCVIWADYDKSGFRYATTIYTVLEQTKCKLQVLSVAPLGLPYGGDCVDWLNANPHSNIDDFLSIPRLDKMPPMDDSDLQDKLDTQNQSTDQGKLDTQSQATDLVAYVLEHVELFHDNNKEVFALDNDTKEVRQIDGRAFRDFMTSNFYEYSGKSDLHRV